MSEESNNVAKQQPRLDLGTLLPLIGAAPGEGTRSVMHAGPNAGRTTSDQVNRPRDQMSNEVRQHIANLAHNDEDSASFLYRLYALYGEESIRTVSLRLGPITFWVLRQHYFDNVELLWAAIQDDSYQKALDEEYYFDLLDSVSKLSPDTTQLD